MPLVGGGEVFVVVGGGALFVVVGGGVGAGVGVGDEVVVGGGEPWVVVGAGAGLDAVATGAGARTISTRLACTCGFEASVTLRSWRPAATPWNVILAPALRLTEPRT
jgi:hypothetical protein